MSAFSDAAFAVVRGWTWLYTCRLPDEMRKTRRLEIESDLWESRRDAAGAPEARVVAHVLLRLVLGIPDDLQWRLETHVVRDRLQNPAWAHAVIAATAAALLLVAVWAVTAAQDAPVPPDRPDPRVFVVGSPAQPHPPPPP